MCTYESLCSMPWVRSAIDNVLKRLWAANAYDQLFTSFVAFPPLKIVGEDPGRCKVLEDILSSVHQRRGEVWRIASARSNSRPLNAPQELLQSSQVRGQRTVFSFFFHFKSSAPQELLQPSQVRGHVRSAGDRTNQASPLLLRHWYEIMALYYVKSILTEISASRQDSE